MQEFFKRLSKGWEILTKGIPIIPTIPEPRKIVFGIQQGLSIFLKTNGRFTGDTSKAVPFSILATAELLGADIQIRPQGQAMLKDIGKSVQENEDLLEKTKIRLLALGAQKKELESAMEFFTIE